MLDDYRFIFFYDTYNHREIWSEHFFLNLLLNKTTKLVEINVKCQITIAHIKKLQIFNLIP